MRDILVHMRICIHGRQIIRSSKCSLPSATDALISTNFTIVKFHTIFLILDTFCWPVLWHAWKLTVDNLVKKLSVFKKLEAAVPFLWKLWLGHILSQVNSSHSPCFTKTIVMMFFCLYLGLLSSLFFQDFSTNYCMLFLIPLVWYIRWFALFFTY
jgi:hypothetical protein